MKLQETWLGVGRGPEANPRDGCLAVSTDEEPHPSPSSWSANWSQVGASAPAVAAL